MRAADLFLIVVVVLAALQILAIVVARIAARARRVDVVAGALRKEALAERSAPPVPAARPLPGAAIESPRVHRGRAASSAAAAARRGVVWAAILERRGDIG